MSSSSPCRIECQFMVEKWSETPFHELDGAGKLSRASIVNRLSGGFAGQGTLEYLLTYPANPGKDVPFIGYERMEGEQGSRKGSFVIKHDGVFSPTAGVSGQLAIIPGSGTGDFAGIAGSGTITAKPGEHGGIYALELQPAS